MKIRALMTATALICAGGFCDGGNYIAAVASMVLFAVLIRPFMEENHGIKG